MGTAKHRIWLQLLAVPTAYPIYDTHTQHHTHQTTLNKLKSVNKIRNNNENKINIDKYLKNINENTKETVGLTKGTLDHLFLLNSIRKISPKNLSKSTENSQKPFFEKSVPENDTLPIDNLSVKHEILSETLSDNVTIIQLNDEVEKKEKTETKEVKEKIINEKMNVLNDAKVWSHCDSKSVVDRMLQQQDSRPWTVGEDGILIKYLESVARMTGISPLNISPYLLSSSHERINLYVQTQQQRRQHTQINKNVCTNDFFDEIRTLLTNRTEEEIHIRVMLLLHFNDLLLPLLALVTSLDGSEVPIGGQNHPTQLLKNLRHLIFLPIIAETTHRLCSSCSSGSGGGGGGGGGVVSTSAQETDIRDNNELMKRNKLKIQTQSLSPLCSPPLSVLSTPLTGTTMNSFSEPGDSSYLSTSLSPTLTFSPSLTSLPNPSSSPSFLIPTLVPLLDPMPGSTVSSGINDNTRSSSSSDHFNNSATSSKILDPTMIDSRNISDKMKKSLFLNSTAMKMNENRNDVTNDNGFLHILEIEDKQSCLNSFSNITVKNKTVRKVNIENNGCENANEMNFDNSHSNVLLEVDDSWNLQSTIQNSLLGQMMTKFNVFCHVPKGGYFIDNIRKNGNSNDSKHGFNNNNINSFESSLRSICSKNILWSENIYSLTETQRFPFYIRTKKRNENKKSFEKGNYDPNRGNIACKSRLFQLLALSEISDTELFDDYKPKLTNNGISQKNIFKIFVIEALEEVFPVYCYCVIHFVDSYLHHCYCCCFHY